MCHHRTTPWLSIFLSHLRSVSREHCIPFVQHHLWQRFAAVDSNVVFWTPEISVCELAPFQLSLTAPANTPISALPFSSLAVHFSHRDSPIIIRHRNSEAATYAGFQRVDLGHISDVHEEFTADIRWQPGSSLIVSGTLSSNVPAILKVCGYESPKSNSTSTEPYRVDFQARFDHHRRHVEY